MIINHKYEREQDRHEEWHDAITDLCNQGSPLIRKLADSLHQKVTDRVGHVEITDWSMVKERCDDVCKCTYEFIRKIATKGEKFSVSIFFKKVEDGENQYTMISRISYDGHSPASYNVFRKESEIASYYYVGLFKKSITRPSILVTKEAIEAAFCDTDGVNYSQYVAMPIACTGNKMIALLQIVAYEDSVIAKDKNEIEKIVANYLSSYANLFERYKRTEKKGLFVDLDFAQLYALAEIDKTLRHLIMTQSLEIENTLKLQILTFFNKNKELSDLILHRYIMSDKEFLMNTYNDARFDILKEKYKDFSFENLRIEQFLDVIQFGTLERLYIYLCENYEYCDLKCLKVIKECLSSVRHLRNAAAHNNSILSNANKKIEDEHNCFSSKYLYQFLKKRGCGKKTLETNLTKEVIRDLCNLEYLFKFVDTPKQQYKWYNEWYHFWENISIEYGQLLFKNERLKSTCTFLQNVNRILLLEILEIKVDYGKK